MIKYLVTALLFCLLSDSIEAKKTKKGKTKISKRSKDAKTEDEDDYK
jgi:hypothetical protein